MMQCEFLASSESIAGGAPNCKTGELRLFDLGTMLIDSCYPFQTYKLYNYEVKHKQADENILSELFFTDKYINLI